MKKQSKFWVFIGNLIWFMKRYKYKTKIISDNPAPETVKERVVYIVGNENYVKWAYLKCPCGCGEVIMLSLANNNFPSWKVESDRIGRPNISPSIHKLDGCRSHFWIKKGNIRWAYEAVDSNSRL